MSLKAVPLAEVASIVSGFAFKSNQFNSTGDGLPLIRIRDVTVGRSGTFYPGPYRDDFVVNDGDALIGMDGEFNLGIWRGGKALLNQRVCRVESTDDRLSQEYLVRFLPSALKEIEARTPFVTVKHLSIKELRAITVPLPALQEQRRIAGILDKADALRAKRREAIAKLDQLLQSVFLDMFGDQVTNPHGWYESQTLGEVADIVSGITKGRRTSDPVREVPYLAVSNVQDRTLKLDVVKTILATEQEIEKFRLHVADLLLTEGGDPDKLGRGALWKGSLPECIHQNHVFRVRLTSDAVDPIYLSWYVSGSRAKRYFASQAKQTTGIASINMRQLRNLPLLVPPLSLQRRFARHVEQIDQQKCLLQVDAGKQHTLSASLQHRAFSGTL